MSTHVISSPLTGLLPAHALLHHVIQMALKKECGQRYQAVTDLLEALRGSSSEGLAVTVSPEPEVHSIAVLPFTNLSSDPEQEYFCDGLAEELIDALARLDGLRVVGRTSSFQFRGEGHDLREVGQKLSVRTVLEGSVRKAGNRLRVNAQLIDTDDGYHVWSERYDRELTDVFAVQDDIAAAVLEKLKGQLLGTRDTPRVPSVTSLEAYNLFLQGRHFFEKLTRAELEKAVRCFEGALEIASGYGQAHAGLALARTLQAGLSFAPPRQIMPSAKESALTALRLDDSLAEAHVALGLVSHWYEWDRAAAERHYQRAFELSPGDMYPGNWYALLLLVQGRVDAAVVEIRRVIDRDPLAPFSRFVLGLALVAGRQFDAAIEETKVGLSLQPHYSPLYWPMGWALGALGRYGEAVEVLRPGTLAAPGDPHPLAQLGWALGHAGERDEAAAILRDLEQRRAGEYVSGYMMAISCLGVGDHEKAISWLEQAAEERDCLLDYVYTWPSFDPLRSDGRFAAVLRAMNFPNAGHASA